MSKKRNRSDSGRRREQERVFLNRLAALTSTAEGHDQLALDDDLRDCGIDPTELRKIAHDRLRRVANHSYSTLDKETPAKLRDFLRQMRPPTPEEEQRNEQAQATSKISDLLSSIRARIASTFGSPMVAAPLRISSQCCIGSRSNSWLMCGRIPCRGSIPTIQPIRSVKDCMRWRFDTSPWATHWVGAPKTHLAMKTGRDVGIIVNRAPRSRRPGPLHLTATV